MPVDEQTIMQPVKKDEVREASLMSLVIRFLKGKFSKPELKVRLIVMSKPGI